MYLRHFICLMYHEFIGSLKKEGTILSGVALSID